MVRYTVPDLSFYTGFCLHKELFITTKKTAVFLQVWRLHRLHVGAECNPNFKQLRALLQPLLQPQDTKLRKAIGSRRFISFN